MRYNFVQTQEGLLDLELLQLPKGASADALRTHETLKPLSCDDYRRLAPRECPVVFDDYKTSIMRETTKNGAEWVGQRNKRTDEWDGITRMVHLGSIVEAQYKAGQKHGFCRSIGADGTYREETFFMGKLDGAQSLYDQSGKLLSQKHYSEGKDVGN